MDITVNNVFRAYGNFKAEKPVLAERTSRAAEKADSVEVTSKAREFSAVMNAMSSKQDLRSDKVADIKTNIELGLYNISSSAVANKILGGYYKSLE